MSSNRIELNKVTSHTSRTSRTSRTSSNGLRRSSLDFSHDNLHRDSETGNKGNFTPTSENKQQLQRQSDSPESSKGQAPNRLATAPAQNSPDEPGAKTEINGTVQRPIAEPEPKPSPHPDLDLTSQRPPPLTQAISTPSSRPYSAFPQSTKWLIVGISGMAGLFSPISSNIFVPAIPTLAQEFKRTEQDISLAVTVYLVFQAVTPSFFGSMSDSFGRRPIYIGTLVLYMGANVGLAVMPTSAYWLLLFLRALQSTGGSAVVSIGAGSISDIAEPRERGKFYATFQLGALLGPAFGPLLGGVLTETLGWRSIFWFLTIATGVVLVPLVLFLPESLRSLVGDGSIPPPFINMSPLMMIRHRRMKKDYAKRGEERVHVERPPKKNYQPLSAFLILFTPEIFLMFFFASLLYMEFYCILTIYSTALKNTYQLNELKIGLAYLPNGFGTLVASQLNGRQLDWFYRREERRVGGDYRKAGEDFQLEYTRIRCLIPFMAVFLVGATAQGWTLQVHAPLAATLVLGFIVGLGSGTINTATLYGQDLMPGKGGAVSASFNLVRCLFGALGTGVVQIIYARLGAGWTLVLFSGICIAGIPAPVLVVRMARRWRESRRRTEEAKVFKNENGEVEMGNELHYEVRRRMILSSGRIERPLAKLRIETNESRPVASGKGQ